MFQYKISWWALNFGIVSFFIWFSRPLDQNCSSRCGLIFKILQLNVRWNGTIHTHRLREYIFEGGSFYQKPTSQYGDLNILWKCFHRSYWLYISIAQWSKALYCLVTHRFWKKKLKSYYHKKLEIAYFLSIN